MFELLKLFFTLSQAPQLYAPHPAGYPQVSPPTSLQYMSDPGTVMGSSGVVSGFLCLALTSPYNLRANSLQTGSDCVVCVRSKWARMMNECVVGGALMSGGWGSGNVVVGVGLGYWHGAKNSGQHSCVCFPSTTDPIRIRKIVVHLT